MSTYNVSGLVRRHTVILPNKVSHLKILVVDGIIKLRPIFKAWIGRLWTGFVWLRAQTKCRQQWTGYKPSSSIKGGEFLDYLRNYQLLKNDCVFFIVRGPRSWWRWAVFYQVLQVMEHQWNEIDRGKPTTRRKTCLSATLSTTNLTWTDPGSNPGLRGERPATNRLSHGTA
jgi:hypothetical protein